MAPEDNRESRGDSRAEQNADRGPDADGGGDVVVTLPEELRAAFKEPLGPVYTDAEDLLAEAGDPLIAVGDIVTYHFEQADRRPDVALIDGRTKRRAVDEEIRETVEARPDRIDAVNPPGTLTEDLLAALIEALGRSGPTTVAVDGEEDLAALPAVLAAPEGATVVYGQPDRGMVAVDVTAETRAEFRDLLERMDGDHERLWSLLDAD